MYGYFLMKKTEIEPVGIIHTPYKKLGDIPCQGYKSDKTGTIEIYKEYEQGLEDTEGFSHLIILYLFHEAKGYSLHSMPFLGRKLRGIFAIRSPYRPNHIGLSVVKLLGRTNNLLEVGNVDMLEGTPLLDIKPYVPKFDIRENARFGWLEDKL